MTLPSNSSMELYSNNTLTEFTTQLPHALDLKGYWEVGLAEIQYPHDWSNINVDVPRFWVKTEMEDTWHTFQLQKGYYNTPEQLVDDLNHCQGIDEKTGTLSYNTLSERFPVTFHFLNVTQRVRLKVGAACQVIIASELKKFLGLTQLPHEIPSGIFVGREQLDLNQGFYALYVYCDLVEHRIVGDKKVQLLRVVPLEGQGGQVVTKEYQHVHYLPLKRKNFDTVSVYLRKDTGERVPFNKGKVVVTLHFRKRLL